MTHRRRMTLRSLGAAFLWVGAATAQNVTTDTGIVGENPARGDGAIQPGTLEHTTGAGDTDAMPGTTTKGQTAMSAPVSATAEEIAQHPGQFFGKRVTVTTSVDRSIDPHFFTLESAAGSERAPDTQGAPAEPFRGQPVLVIIESPARAAAEQTKVTITGFVRPFVSTDVAREYSWFESDWLKQANVDTQTTPQPLIVADSVMTSDGMQLVQTAPAGSRIEAGDAPLRKPPLPNPPAPPHREREPMPGPDAID